MATTSNQFVFIDGSFQELATELAGHLAIESEVQTLIEGNKKDEVLKLLVGASSKLNSTPEKEFTAAYNLLIYLVMQSPSVNSFLQQMCQNLSKPVTSSPANGTGLALNALTTIFNLLAPDNAVRQNVFKAILSLIKRNGLYEIVKPQLKKIDTWVTEWDLDEDDQRDLFVEIADAALQGGEEEESYKYILKALRTYTPDDEELSSEEAQKLSLRALKAAFLSPTHFDFHDLTSLPAIRALESSHEIYSELLEIFSEKELEDYDDFREEHDTFVEDEGLDASKLHRKMRLLTLASLAAAANNKELEYARIAKALSIPAEDVEMWVIDVIRAGLVEGKLSQQKKMFLVHRTTYRVFGDKQWREVGSKVEQWRTSLKAVKEVISRERQQAETQKEREMHEVERKANGASGMGAGRRIGGGRDNMVEMGTD